MNKKSISILTLVTLTVAIASVACTSNNKTEENKSLTETKTISEDSLIVKGEHLVTIMGCNDCHSPKIMGKFGPEPDPQRLLSGHPSNLPMGKVDPAQLKEWVLFNHMSTAVVGPWGVSFAANITSDISGIGSWTEEQFFTAIRKGKYKGMENGRNLLPPMPWPTYAKATDEELRAIFAYLKSTPPIENVVPAPIPPDALSTSAKK